RSNGAPAPWEASATLPPPELPPSELPPSELPPSEPPRPLRERMSRLCATGEGSAGSVSRRGPRPLPAPHPEELHAPPDDQQRGGDGEQPAQRGLEQGALQQPRALHEHRLPIGPDHDVRAFTQDGVRVGEEERPRARDQEEAGVLVEERRDFRGLP